MCIGLRKRSRLYKRITNIAHQPLPAEAVEMHYLETEDKKLQISVVLVQQESYAISEFFFAGLRPRNH